MMKKMVMCMLLKSTSKISIYGLKKGIYAKKKKKKRRKW
jgi:hypothetical protein